MNNERVLVTGGAGLIGSHITDLLIDEGVEEIVILDVLALIDRDGLGGDLNIGP